MKVEDDCYRRITVRRR